MSCPDCIRGSILDGTPSGTVKQVDGIDAYFVSGVSEPTSKSFSVVLLTDVFGLEVVNSKLIADRIASALACDVWVPDLFNGQPAIKPDSMEAQLLPDHPGPWPLWDKLRFYARVIWNIGSFYRARPSVVTPRTAKFIKSVREQNIYDKVGAVGYCFGAGIAVRLVPFKALDSIVLCHPSLLTEASIKAIDVPTAWACAEEDMALSKAMRLNAEAIFAARKDRPDFVPYEFVDYMGTVHGFACRPNLAYDGMKAGFEGSLSQTVEWFRKTLVS
ncbi:dienelactone hydrolase endo-1,3,1,4-beta-D-glucanase [Boletus edulis BED1]|uniref:Dienelactone hydrolase endo-1,3,1,4-beta-D-glucanase n=1 Tax=Boletus edulis BED1 TaxID=1328754 RepID=A0AAD4BVJ3_BOLED|nr:dienelactone hydrolase endo-1,3,1,4-beta-D-glucanase [Boletus edulis BED1]